MEVCRQWLLHCLKFISMHKGGLNRPYGIKGYRSNNNVVSYCCCNFSNSSSNMADTVAAPLLWKLVKILHWGCHKGGMAGPTEDVTLRNGVSVIWLVMTSYEPWARVIYIKRNATESDKERKKERLESCHPDLVVPDRWPVRHTSSWCVWLPASHTRRHTNMSLSTCCCPPLSTLSISVFN